VVDVGNDGDVAKVHRGSEIDLWAGF
jgi:hypothetical protein